MTLIDFAGLGLVDKVLSYLPKGRADDVLVISPEHNRHICLFPVADKDAHEAVLDAAAQSSNQHGSLLRRWFAWRAAEVGPTEMRPAGVENRMLALFLRLVDELNNPTWDCDRDCPGEFHELVEPLLPPLLMVWADPPAAAMLFASREAPLYLGDRILLVEPGVLHPHNVHLLLPLIRPLFIPAATWMVTGPGGEELSGVEHVWVDGMEARTSVPMEGDPLGEPDVELAANIRQLSRLKFASDSFIVGQEISDVVREKGPKFAKQALFDADSQAAELAAWCQDPAAFSRRLPDQRTSRAIDYLDLRTPALVAAAKAVLKP